MHPLQKGHSPTSVRGSCLTWKLWQHNVQPANPLQPCTGILGSPLDTMKGRGQPPDVLGLLNDPAASPAGVLLAVPAGLLAVLGLLPGVLLASFSSLHRARRSCPALGGSSCFGHKLN